MSLSDAEYERAVAESAEADRLQTAIFNALQAYGDFLDRAGLIWDHSKTDGGPFKATKLVAELDFRSTIFEIKLKGGALDRQRPLSKPAAH